MIFNQQNRRFPFAAELLGQTAQAWVRNRLGDETHSLSLVRGSTVRIDPSAALNSGVLGEAGAACLGPLTMSQESIRRGLGVEDVGAVVDRLVEVGAAERVTTAGHLRLNKRSQKGE